MAEAGVQIRKAISDDIASIVELNFALFQEDAGQRDPYMNLNWPKEDKLPIPKAHAFAEYVAVR